MPNLDTGADKRFGNGVADLATQLNTRVEVKIEATYDSISASKWWGDFVAGYGVNEGKRRPLIFVNK